MNERIKQIRKEAGLTLEKFGKRIGITAASCSTIESGKSNPSTQTIRSICREFGVNETWLRTGTGEPHANRTRMQELDEIFEKVKLGDDARSRLTRATARLPDGAAEKFLSFVEELAKTLSEE